MAGLLDALRQYVSDASPGGSLNPEQPAMLSGLLDYGKKKVNYLVGMLGDAATTGAQAYGSASGPLAPQHAQTLGGLLMDFSPLGDVKSAYDGVQSAREGDYLGAALGGLGALPMVPNFGGIIRDLPTPKWNKARGDPSFPVGDWVDEAAMNMSEFRELLKDLQAKSAGNSLRALKNDKTGRIGYAWPEGAALHGDVGAALKLDPADWTHTYISPPK